MSLRIKLLTATALVAAPFAVAAADLTFAPVPFAGDAAAKRQVLASSSAVINGKPYNIGYHVLARSGDKLGGGVFGALVDKDGNVVKSADGADHISADADHTSLLPVGDKLFSVTHFESRPGAMYVSEVAQDENGVLSYVSTKPVDFSEFGGLWVPCAGSVTPWGAHLGGEEYPPNARAVENAASLDDIDDYYKPMVRYQGVNTADMSLEDFKAAFKPYAYGYPTEIVVSEDGAAEAHKHYAMGRVAIELAYVMPDQKTVYITDDGTNGVFSMFIADKAGDLSAGDLYAAKWTQTSGEGAGAAGISWVYLGHADNASIAKYIADDIKFSDIFSVGDMAEDGSCSGGYLPSNAAGKAECLMVKPGMEMAASRLETRRYAAMLGATSEFRKMEGFAHNPDKGVAYLAISSVERGMEDGEAKRDKGGYNAIRLEKNKCGAVYELGLTSDYRVTSASAIVAGKPVAGMEAAAADPNCDPAHNMCGGVVEGNSCAIDGIANPDNITFIPGTNTLIIGEDTGSGHQNDVIWSMNLASGELTRIFSTPYGSETTSPYWYPNIGGHAYLMAVVQHPYGESDEDKLQDAADARAYVGFVGPFPAMDK